MAEINTRRIGLVVSSLTCIVGSSFGYRYYRTNYPEQFRANVWNPLIQNRLYPGLLATVVSNFSQPISCFRRDMTWHEGAS